MKPAFEHVQLTIFGTEEYDPAEEAHGKPPATTYVPPTVEELRSFAQERAQVLWGLEFNIPIYLVKANWKRRRASFVYTADRSSQPYIKMSSTVNANMPREAVFSILLHEMVHWRKYGTRRAYRRRER